MEEAKLPLTIIKRQKLYRYLNNIVVSVESLSSFEVIKDFLLTKIKCKDDIEKVKNPYGAKGDEFMKMAKQMEKMIKGMGQGEDRQKMIEQLEKKFNVADVLTTQYSGEDEEEDEDEEINDEDDDMREEGALPTVAEELKEGDMRIPPFKKSQSTPKGETPPVDELSQDTKIEDHEIYNCELKFYTQENQELSSSTTFYQFIRQGQ